MTSIAKVFSRLHMIYCNRSYRLWAFDLIKSLNRAYNGRHTRTSAISPITFEVRLMDAFHYFRKLWIPARFPVITRFLKIAPPLSNILHKKSLPSGSVVHLFDNSGDDCAKPGSTSKRATTSYKQQIARIPSFRFDGIIVLCIGEIPTKRDVR